MSYEAVPCVVRAPSQDGAKETILGVIIRPSSSTEGGRMNPPPPPPPGVFPIKGAKSIVIQPGTKRSLIISPDQMQKMGLSGGMMRLPHPPVWSAATPSTSAAAAAAAGTSQGAAPPRMVVGSPQGLDRVSSPSWSHRLHSMEAGTSCTPDSGIQSVPTTPPHCSTQKTSPDEKEEEEVEFDDMPRLIPVDAGEAGPSTSPSLPHPPPSLDESSICHGSECETNLPSALTKTSWNPEEIATQLLSMAAFDPRKIEEVTALMLQRSKADVEKKAEEGKKRKRGEGGTIPSSSLSSLPPSKKKKREKEREVEGSSEEKGEEPRKERDGSEEEPRDKEANLIQYRLAMRRRIMDKVEETSDCITASLSRMAIERGKRKENGMKKWIFSPIRWEEVKERHKVKFSELLRKEMKGEEKKKVVEKRKRKEERKKEGKKERGEREKKRRGEEEEEKFEVIKQNILHPSSSPLPSLSCPLPCLCQRGGCISSGDCIHRAARVFCSPSSCTLPTCSNRFTPSTSIYLSKGVLKTKDPRKANEYLGEMVGEVVSIEEMASRLSSPSPSPSSSPLPTRAFTLSPSHYIDCTERGAITRYVRHSCQANSSLQVWFDAGVPHLCLFSRFPLASNSEITVDLSFLTPQGMKCTCSSRRCKKEVPPAMAPIPYPVDTVSLPSGSKTGPEERLFLRRNLRVREEKERKEGVLYPLYRSIGLRLRRGDGRIERKYARGMEKLRSASLNSDTQLFVSLVAQLELLTEKAVDTHALSCIRTRLLKGGERKEEEEKEKKKRRSDSHQTRGTDTSYIDSGVPVGSYNPDEWRGGETSSEDAVRCCCGVAEDDGEMIECDQCHFWLHSDCISTPSEGAYSCPLCLEGTASPHGDVKLKIQPEIRLDGCTYYKALENSAKMQIRLNECVYVRKLKNDHYKKMLRGLEKKKGGKEGERSKIMDDDSPLIAPSDLADPMPTRSLLRVFRVERLFEAPGGKRFLFGFYYARPHETFCDENRLFHPNEVFATPFYDTLPLDAVAGKCIVMDTAMYCKGRTVFPSYKEQDVLVCEYQLDRNQRHFDKCKNSYLLNTEPYAFQKFDRDRTLQRCFTPFTYSSPSTSTAISTWSQEEINSILRQKSTARMDKIIKRISSAH